MYYRTVISFILVSLAYGRLMEFQNKTTIENQQQQQFRSEKVSVDVDHHDSKTRGLSQTHPFETSVCFDLSDKHVCVGSIQLGDTGQQVQVTTQANQTFQPHHLASLCSATYNQVPCRYCRTCGNHMNRMTLDCSNVIANSSCSRINCDGTCHSTSRGSVWISELAAFKHAMLASAMLSVIVMTFVRSIFQTCCKHQRQQHQQQQLLAMTDFEESYPPEQELTAERQELIEASLIRKSATLDENERIIHKDESDKAGLNTSKTNNSHEENYTMLSTNDTDIPNETENDSEKQQHVCQVCLEPLADEVAESRVSNCRHAFHYECIVAWLQSRNDCPCCRANFLMVQGPGTLA